MTASIVRDIKDVTNMSRIREVVEPPYPVAAVWKASRYKPVTGEYGSVEYVEAERDASWRITDPFGTYTPIEARIFDEDVPHVVFSKLSKMRQELGNAWRSRSEGTLEAYVTATCVFATQFGLLGLFQETFAAPILPERADRGAVWLAPDTVLDKHGRMHAVNPATEGKACLEKLMNVRDPRTGLKAGFKADQLVFPHELRFSSTSFTSFGLLPPVFGSSDANTWTWEGVKNLYGVRALLDPHAGLSRVSIVPTREPLLFWEAPLEDFPRSPCPPESLNSRLEGVTPHAVAGEDGRPRSSWRCPSLLKAIYLMLYLDETSGGKIQECRAPGCPNYFRVGPRSRESMYCPPPPGKKQSPCASRASSRMHRERQRRSPDAT